MGRRKITKFAHCATLSTYVYLNNTDFDFKLYFTEQLTNSAWSKLSAQNSGEALAKISQILELDFKPHTIQADFKVPKKSKIKFKTVLNNLKKHFKSKFLATKDSATAFLKILQVVNQASENDLKTLFNDKTIKDIL